jgi:hypothetical protein
MQRKIPPALRNWDVDVTMVGPALFDAGRLDEAPGYPDRSRLVGTIVDGWTPAECVAALEEDRGGIRTLFEAAVTDENCGWLATIPIFREARCQAQQEGAVQHLLFRRLFLHTDFDPRLPPTLLSSLRISRDCPVVQDRALHHAVLYLENGNEADVEPLDLPWEDASVQLTERAAAALFNSDSAVWRRLDITKLRGGRFLDLVPAQHLSRLAYEEALRARDNIKANQARILQLENHARELERTVKDHAKIREKLETNVRKLERKVAGLERQVSQQYREIH